MKLRTTICIEKVINSTLFHFRSDCFNNAILSHPLLLAYRAWVPDIISAFIPVLGDRAAHVHVIPINSHPKFQFNILDKVTCVKVLLYRRIHDFLSFDLVILNSQSEFFFQSYEWYTGPTLSEVLQNSTNFRAPYTSADILGLPVFLQMHPATSLTLNLRT